MEPSKLSSFLGGSLAILLVGCVGSQSTETKSLPPTSPTQPVHPIGGAIDSAAQLLREQGLDWGEPRQVLRTVSNWYRLEYASDPQGRERVVLVNPANNQAEFPLPR